MTRSEVINLIKQSPQFKLTYRTGFITVITKKNNYLDKFFPIKKFALWAKIDSFNLFWGWAAAEIGEIPKTGDYKMLGADTLYNWLDCLELYVEK